MEIKINMQKYKKKRNFYMYAKKILFMWNKNRNNQGIIFGVFSNLGQNPNFNQNGISYLIFVIFTIYIQK